MIRLPRPHATLSAACATFTAAVTLAAEPARDYSSRVATVTGTPGCVAFWDFVQREPAGAHRFVAHVPAGATNTFPLDAGNYIRDYWGVGREATYADFPLLGRGPFGEAIRIRQETDAAFRPLLLVPRARLHDSPIDLKGPHQSVTVVVWAIRESGNHALAGIWHEGTDLRIAKGDMCELSTKSGKRGRLWGFGGEAVNASHIFRHPLLHSPGPAI